MAFTPNLPWHHLVLEDLRTTTLTYAQLAQKFRRSPDTIYRIARDAGIIRPVGVPQHQPKACEEDPQTSIHRMIGIRLSGYPNRQALVEKLGCSWPKMRRMELGVHDYTLNELLTIQEVLGIPLVDLITLPKPLKATA